LKLRVMFLLGELHIIIAELAGAVARRSYLGRPGGEYTALREKLAAEYARAGYNGVEAAGLLGTGVALARDVLRGEADRPGRGLAIPPAALYRRALVALTMSLNGEIYVPDDCAARLVELDADEQRLLAEEALAVACRHAAGSREDGPFAAGLARYLVALHALSDSAVPLEKVAGHYGAVLAGRAWDLSAHGDFARKKADVLCLQRPAGRQRVHLRRCGVPAALVLALGRNTWAVQQSDPHAAQPPLDTFLPGVERCLAAYLPAEVRRSAG
jgi:hypothetical protein